ncbi:hypothetical protein TDIS_1055 [Thermosulfurimonas dismutans]|uniref:Uncharacterized protein n=1 Tax=Thermosulfurimonas dismutans TaxID=999894 RepID=A0A179D3Z7_9BACT|nr:hypothetical protein TDIS_1055 [Thermosulfurimonas dismutans]
MLTSIDLDFGSINPNTPSGSKNEGQVTGERYLSTELFRT